MPISLMQPCRIPPLLSGGIMLSYRCSSTCKHCLYNCSPRQPDEWMTTDTAGKLVDALLKEPRLGGLHLAGGEPTLRPELLVEMIRLITAAGLSLEYVETNAGWCRDRARAKVLMERMRAAGLRCMLVSVSMFHNEFIPFSSTRNCIELCREVFGPSGVFVYMPHIYDILATMPDDGTHTLEEFMAHAGIRDRAELAEMYSLTPGGRAPRALRTSYRPEPAESFRGQTCRNQLLSTSHFHIDHMGRLFTGTCAGILAGAIGDLHPLKTPQTSPVFVSLCERGPVALMDVAVEKYGFAPDREGYVSKCDLCFKVRRHLVAAGGYPELQPASFYEEEL